jgi:hypothetical protein
MLGGWGTPMSTLQRLKDSFHRLRRWLPVLAFSGVMLSGSAVRAEAMRCEVTSKFACTPAGCATNKLGVFNLIDLDLSTFSRCDASGCDKYPANFTRSGVYILVDVPGRGMLAKMSVNGAEYVEVATLGSAVLVSFGSCSAQ